jgi:hypothetical protein
MQFIFKRTIHDNICPLLYEVCRVLHGQNEMFFLHKNGISRDKRGSHQLYRGHEPPILPMKGNTIILSFHKRIPMVMLEWRSISYIIDQWIKMGEIMPTYINKVVHVSTIINP